MQNRFSSAALSLILLGGFAMAQTPAQAPTPNRAPATSNTQAGNQLTPQMLVAMLSSAATFHELVQNLNVGKALGPDQHVVGADGQLHHSMERTAQTIGAGAGAGAAVGAMTHSQNGVLIGALVGAGSGILIDQILRYHEEQRERAAVVPAPDPVYTPQDRPREFKTRDGDLQHRAD